MRTTIFAMMLLSCNAESHVLLSAHDDGGSNSDAGSSSDAGVTSAMWTDCVAALNGGARMGDSCAWGDSACSNVDPEAGGAQCYRGEVLIGTATAGPGVDGDCTGTVIEPSGGGRLEPTGRPSPGCFTARRCTTASYELTYCQTGPRAALRADAQTVTDCASALTTARDGDACTGDFFCGGESDGHGLLAWCDGGILRLGSVYPLYGGV